MALDKFLAALETDARDQAARLLDAARAEAAQVAEAAATRCDARRRDTLAAREQDRRAVVELELGVTRRAARGSVLEARQQLLDRVFRTAATLLEAAPAREAYVRVLPAHLADALACAGDGPVEIRCPALLVASIRARVKSRPHVRVVATPGPVGFTVLARDGAVEIDSTLVARLERARPRLVIEAMRALEAPA